VSSVTGESWRVKKDAEFEAKMWKIDSVDTVVLHMNLFFILTKMCDNDNA